MCDDIIRCAVKLQNDVYIALHCADRNCNNDIKFVKINVYLE